MTYNTQKRMADLPPVDINELDSFQRVEDDNVHLREELEAERDQRLRLAAEYKNFRRRTEQENSAAADKGKRELLIQLMSLGDDLDRALAASNESVEAVADGLHIIHRSFRDILKANGVIPFESEGERFDPELHDSGELLEQLDLSTRTRESRQAIHPEPPKKGKSTKLYWRIPDLKRAHVVEALYSDFWAAQHAFINLAVVPLGVCD